MVTFPEWADWVNKQLAGHQASLKRQDEKLSEIANKLSRVYAAFLEPYVLDLLRIDGKPRTWRWIFNRLGPDAWRSLHDLIARGHVTVVRSGHNVMYVAAKKEHAK